MEKYMKIKRGKKGVTLLELLISVVIIVIVLMGTVSAFAASYNSVLIGAEKDKASATAQTVSDVIASVINGKQKSTFWVSNKLIDAYKDNFKTDLTLQETSYCTNAATMTTGTHAKGDIRYTLIIKPIKPVDSVVEKDVVVVKTIVYYSPTKYVEAESTATIAN